MTWEPSQLANCYVMPRIKEISYPFILLFTTNPGELPPINLPKPTIGAPPKLLASLHRLHQQRCQRSAIANLSCSMPRDKTTNVV